MVMPIIEGLIGSFAGDFITKKAKEKPISHVQSLVQGGSKSFEYANTIIAAGATQWVFVANQFPAARIFEPLDSITITNNSAVDILVYLNSASDWVQIPAYMIKPIARKPVRAFGLYNPSAGNIAADLILVSLKRLPPNVQVVTNA